MLLDFLMPGYGFFVAGGRVYIHRMASTLTQQHAAMFFKEPNKIPPLHSSADGQFHLLSPRILCESRFTIDL